MKNKSPYLENNRRLADVITAIQVMARFPKYASRNLRKWEKRLGSPVSASTWDDIITDHPEFFRKRTESDDEDDDAPIKVSLNWRWSFDKNYSPDVGRCLTEEEMKEWQKQSKENRRRLTKPPLSSEQTEILINTAISLHNSAISNEAQRRWWVRIVVPAVTVLIAAALGFCGATLRADSITLKGKTRVTIQQIEEKPSN